jgi:hypothetical protein
MKKWMLLTVAVVLVAIVALVPAVFAQGPTDGYGSGYAPTFNGPFGQGPHFVDENGDGVCDNFVDEDGDGVCDLAGSGPHGQGYGRGQGPGFVDEDGDGVCDNFVDEDGDGVCDHAGTGQGRGAGFVDEDGDGVCDHANDGTQSGRHGGGMGRWSQ